MAGQRAERGVRDVAREHTDGIVGPGGSVQLEESAAGRERGLCEIADPSPGDGDIEQRRRTRGEARQVPGDLRRELSSALPRPCNQEIGMEAVRIGQPRVVAMNQKVDYDAGALRHRTVAPLRLILAFAQHQRRGRPEPQRPAIWHRVSGRRHRCHAHDEGRRASNPRRVGHTSGAPRIRTRASAPCPPASADGAAFRVAAAEDVGT